MKTIGIILTILGLLLLGFTIGKGVNGHNKLENEFLSYWKLTMKSTTLEEKSSSLDLFMQKIEKQGFEGKYDALKIKNPNNSFEKNFEVLKEFQKRLHSLKDLNVKSEEYQLAMQQITGQEQIKINDYVVSVLRGIWWKENHILL